MKSVQAVSKMPVVMFSSSWELLLIRRDFASGTRPPYLSYSLSNCMAYSLRNARKRWEASCTFRISNDFDIMIRKDLFGMM